MSFDALIAANFSLNTTEEVLDEEICTNNYLRFLASTTNRYCAGCEAEGDVCNSCNA